MKKYILIIELILFGVIGVKCQPIEVSITDDVIIDVINSFIDSCDVSKNDKYAILIELLEVNSERIILRKPYENTVFIDRDGPNFIDTFIFNISLERNLIHFEKFPPSAYSVFKGHPIAIYTGLEKFIQHNTKDNRKFVKTVRSRLPRSGTYFGYKSWTVRIYGKKIEIINIFLR
ncbi:MAG: hypothetical protein M9954_13800 [Cyclobacteriaceae bacterium]|nr:hypothetical protein [Cyclobacteriaceae bacterium]MCB9236338.1 hypothetical protein [Flammeovirgaceae bacterium]MCO5272727.1 hypothetical protein [Cyclobacteriaceae bacterium]